MCLVSSANGAMRDATVTDATEASTNRTVATAAVAAVTAMFPVSSVVVMPSHMHAMSTLVSGRRGEGG